MSTRSSIELLRDAQARLGGGQVKDADFSRDGQAALLVIDAGGELALYVETVGAAALGVEDRTRSFVLEVRPTNAVPSGRALMLRLADKAFEEPFIRLIDAVAVSAEQTDKPLSDIVRTVARNWRLAFKGRGDRLLSTEEQMALIAELHLLEVLVGVDGLDVLDCWHYGDERTSRHDFESKTAHIEVKATAAREEFSLSIHGLEQLTEYDEVPLYLFAQQFEVAPEGETLPETITRLLAHGLSQPRLEAKLEIAGYFAEDGLEYDLRFAVRRSRARIVDDEVPRISKHFLPRPEVAEQLKRVTYRFDFGPVEGCVEDEQAVAMLREAVTR